MTGIDVSENNGIIDWQAVADSGIEFVFIRLGYGHRHLDSMFYDNYNGAKAAGLKVGVYYYSYALSEDDAEDEAAFVLETLDDAGITSDDISMGIMFDMEDADNYKMSNGIYYDNQLLTNMCSVFINKVWDAGFNAMLYASYDWLTNKLYVEQLGGVAICCAQYNSQCDFGGASMWQCTPEHQIPGNDCYFDLDVEL